MSEDEVQAADQAQEAPPSSRRKHRKLLAALAVVLALVLLAGWLAREQIANRIIAGKLEDLGLPATYKIERIGTDLHILTDVVIGDPAHPDLTIERAEIRTELTFGLPTIGGVTLVKPRLHGTVAGGKVSFGALDKLIYAKRTGPAGLPDLDLRLVDGRARIDSPWGPVGLKTEGEGNLRDGFAGTFAAIAPNAAVGGCQVRQLSAYGKITSKAAAPRFEGPVRLAALDCGKGGPILRQTNVQLVARLGPALDRIDGSYVLNGAASAWQGVRLARASGTGDYTFAKGDLVASYKLAGAGLDAAEARIAELRLEGELRSHDQLAAWQADGSIGGTGVAPGQGIDRALGDLAISGQGTLVEPITRQLRAALRREVTGSTLGATFHLRQTGSITQLVVPGALWRGVGGAHIAQVSRAALTLGQRGGPRFSGNFVTDGAGLPHVSGSFERNGTGGGSARLSLAEYRAGDSRVALPDLRLVQLANGAVGFAGEAQLSGGLPGGRIDNLRLPVEGNWSTRSGLALLRHCTPVRFDGFRVANLQLRGQSLTLCPGREGAIVRIDGRGLRASADTARLALAGTLGSTAVRLTSGAVGLAWPGKLAARDIAVSLGPIEDPNTLKIADLRAELGKTVTGTFARTELRLSAVPLDVLEAAGNWNFAGGDFAISGASLKVRDREKQARFEPLVARDAALHLHSTTFTAQALLREPKSDRVIVETRIEHDLDTMLGHADLAVPGIVFDQQLQPEMLTYYTQGVIALAKGTVTGQGRIDWNRDGVTSSGDFSTKDADFSALFGPVKGVSGTIHFTDLLNLVTAPEQHLHVASINPGIEVADGDVNFQLEPGHVLQVNRGEWPFIDGQLVLLPSRMVLGAAEVRRFTVKVQGIDAALFVQRLQLGNLAATGIFDGTLPLVFDQNGGRIENGLLVSRPPGGNVSYVGELTYKDLSPMGNFVFQALRSLDFRRMEITLDGHIDGEIVTAIQIDGVRQGKGAKRNFLTSRLEGLPIKLNINIRAPFYQLIGSFKSLYDPAYVRNPRELGLIGADGKPLQPAPAPAPTQPSTAPPAPPPAQKQPDIQPPDSRTVP